MNGFEINKIVAAILLAILVAMFGGFLAREFVHPHESDKTAFEVAAVADAPVSGASAVAAGPGDIMPLLAKASVADGEKAIRICASCHSLGKGEPNKIGPNLYGIVMAKHGHAAGYNYSPALASSHDKVWDFKELNHFLYNPRGYISGTKMTFAGIKDDQQRANVIAYLRSLSDSPVAVPKK